MNRPWGAKTVVDLETADKQVLPKSARMQIERVEGLKADWSRIVTEDGRPLMTVGHHFDRSGPVTQQQRENMSREGPATRKSPTSLLACPCFITSPR